MADASQNKRSMERVSGDALRAWLRVPAGLSLPGWAQTRLQGSVLAELQAREGTKLENVVFGIVDLETTGLAARRDRILEIGLVVQCGGRALDHYATLIDVEVPIPRFITRLTGIDARDTAQAPSQADALVGFARVLRQQRVDVLVAHNAPFDRAFLEWAWTRHGHTSALPPFLCSLRLARRWVRASSYGLDVLAEQLRLPVRTRHRALGDAEITASLWQELLQRGRLHGVHTLEALQGIAAVGDSRAGGRRVRVVDDRSTIG
jgi:DNA polymerase-3 subunit epsilon